MILFELSEVALFKIRQDLLNLNSDKTNVHIVSVLGNTLDEKLVESTFIENNVDIVFHAAAYKHVPLVEENPLSGLFNNIFQQKFYVNVQKKQMLRNLFLSPLIRQLDLQILWEHLKEFLN